MKIANVIVALDMKNAQNVKNFVSKFSNPIWFKVGMQLIYAEGFEIIKYIKDRGHKVFLDLKLFDIPSIVKNALESIEKHDVDMTTVHLLGGSEMLQASANLSTKLKILGVTVLTSTNQSSLNNEMKIQGLITDQVKHLASFAQKANLYGIVCSPQESSLLKNLGLVLVTPGIRRKQDFNFDQKRVTTPREAKENGADFIVVGRPITQAQDPVAAYNDFVKEFTYG